MFEQNANQINYLAPIQNLEALTELYLNSNQIKDLAPIQNIKALTVIAQ